MAELWGPWKNEILGGRIITTNYLEEKWTSSLYEARTKVQAQAQGDILTHTDLRLLGKDPELPTRHPKTIPSVPEVLCRCPCLYVKEQREALLLGTGRCLLGFGLLRSELFAGADFRTQGLIWEAVSHGASPDRCVPKEDEGRARRD